MAMAGTCRLLHAVASAGASRKGRDSLDFFVNVMGSGVGVAFLDTLRAWGNIVEDPQGGGGMLFRCSVTYDRPQVVHKTWHNLQFRLPAKLKVVFLRGVWVGGVGEGGGGGGGRWAYESHHPPPVAVGRLMGERLEVMDAGEVGEMLGAVGGAALEEAEDELGLDL